MNNIIELLQGIEVQWKALGEVTNVLRGRRLTRSLLSESERFPVFHGGLDPLGYYGQSNRPANSVMVINVGASAGTVGFSAVEFWSSDGCFCIEHTNLVNSRFLYYVLIGHQQLLRSRVRVAGIPTLDAIVVERLLIPIPPLNIQAEIVRILDNFTELTAKLTAELKAELTARKKQYIYYRDQLLRFKEGEVEWELLGEVVKLQRGRRLVKSQLAESGNYAVFQNCLTPLGYYHESNVKSDTAFIISAGAAGEIGYSNVDFWAADDVYFLLTPDEIESKYLYYFLLTQQNKISAQVRRASIPRLSKTVVEKLIIPIPSVAHQKRIVAILDKFDALTNSLTDSLSREIALRQQQYKYYRELLLSFPKAKVEA